MMQEAKSSCAGQWYLPAGRMEPGEDISEAAQREVLEETGLHFQLSTLLMIESAGKSGVKMPSNNSLFPIEIPRKTDKIIFLREILPRIGVSKYERSECFKLPIRDIFRIRNDFFIKVVFLSVLYKI